MDNELFWKLLKPFHPMAAAFCVKLTGDRDGGNDLYQDALLTAMRKFNSLKDTASFRSWLFRILINSYRNRHRSLWRRRRVDLSQETLNEQPGDDPRDKYNSRRWLEQIMKGLTAEDKALMVLHEIEGWPVIDLAEMFMKPEGTIKIRLFRAKHKMRKTLERYLSKQKSNLSINEAAHALQRSKTAND